MTLRSGRQLLPSDQLLDGGRSDNNDEADDSDRSDNSDEADESDQPNNPQKSKTIFLT